MSDMRASGAYRLRVARNLLLKVWAEGEGPVRLVGPGAWTAGAIEGAA
jgi:xanthine dehydrogenase iron-sulfur cluster and FAD-binding subunit A